MLPAQGFPSLLLCPVIRLCRRYGRQIHPPRALENHFGSPRRASAQFTRNRGDTTVSHDSKADSLSVLLGDDGTAPSSLTNRELENLMQLSDTYPSVRELALELQSAMSQRYSTSTVGEENSQE